MAQTRPGTVAHPICGGRIPELYKIAPDGRTSSSTKRTKHLLGGTPAGARAVGGCGTTVFSCWSKARSASIRLPAVSRENFVAAAPFYGDTGAARRTRDTRLLLLPLDFPSLGGAWLRGLPRGAFQFWLFFLPTAPSYRITGRGRHLRFPCSASSSGHRAVQRFHHASIRLWVRAMTTASDSLLWNERRPVAQSDLRPWLGQRYLPEHPGMRTAPTKLRIVNLVAQHDIESDHQLARHRHFRRSSAFAKSQAAIHAP